ncbi:MAG: oligosaccharide flippase family protein [Beijerinckiaceae bacterium]|nr:oligosaccharide flippase family protein [Beijerinckiaceae bacterium]
MLMIATFTLNAGFNLLVGLLTAKFLGPSDFGRYALAQSIGVFLNTLFIDWLRHVATRFYTENAGSAGVRATLDVMLGLSAFAVAAVSGAAILLGLDFGLSIPLALVAALVGIVNGVFDVQTALLRARFRDRPYATAIILKNLFSIILVVGGAAVFHNPAITLAGLCLSMAAALLSVHRALIDRDARLALATRAQARIFLGYGAPIVAGAVIWQLMPLFNRTLLADRLGFDASGQYSLAYDLGIRIVAAVGSALDILLLQLAIRADHDEGREAARAQLSLNTVIVLAVMAPVCVGLWLVMPSFEALFVPQAFHGSFSRILTALLPGLFAFSILSFCVFQTFFVARRTWPVTVSSLAATLINILVVRASGTTDPAAIAAIQAGGFIVSLGIGIALSYAIFPVNVRAKDIAVVTLATGLVILCVYPLRTLEPGLVTLLVQAATGVIVYAAALWTGNVAGLRGWLASRRSRH